MWMQKIFRLLESSDIVEMKGPWHLFDRINLFLNKVNAKWMVCKSILQVNIIRIILLVWLLFSWGIAVCSLIITIASIYNPVAYVDEIAILPGLIAFKIYSHLSNWMSYTPRFNGDFHSDLGCRRLCNSCYY